MTAHLMRGRVVGEGVKDILLDTNQSLKVVLVDGDGDTLTDDTNDALKVSVVSIEDIEIDLTPTTINGGVVTVTTAGTPVQITETSTPTTMVYIQALYGNTGYIVVGTSGVVATPGSETGIKLAAGEKIPIEISDLNKLYLNSTVNGEKASYIYMV